jgi:hypothetical protein
MTRIEEAVCPPYVETVAEIVEGIMGGNHRRNEFVFGADQTDVDGIALNARRRQRDPRRIVQGKLNVAAEDGEGKNKDEKQRCSQLRCSHISDLRFYYALGIRNLP